MFLSSPTRLHGWLQVVPLSGAVVLTTSLALAAPKQTPSGSASPTTLAERLVALRAEVETLSSDLTLSRAQAKEDLRRHADQVRDLEGELRKEELRLARLNDATTRLSSDAATATADVSSLRPTLVEHANGLRDYVDHALPYRRADRLAAIDRLIDDLETGVVTTTAAAPRLYTLIQDEKRLTEDSERVRETVAIGDERLLVDAVRLGMVTLLFRTDDGRAGRVFRSATTPSKWTVELLNRDEDRAHVATLLDAFGKQIRTGWFDIPLALPPRGTATDTATDTAKTSPATAAAPSTGGLK